MQEVSLDTMYRHLHGSEDQSFQLPKLKKQFKDQIFNMESSAADSSSRASAKIAGYMNIYGTRSKSNAKSKRTSVHSAKPDESRATLSTRRRFSAASKPPKTSGYNSTVNEPIKKTVSDIFEAFESISIQEQKILERLEEDVKLLGMAEAAVSPEPQEAVISEGFNLRLTRPTTSLLYFKGVHKISGVDCIVIVRGDDLGELFHVEMQTLAGDEFGMQVRHKLLPNDLRPEVIRKSFLAFFYLTITEGELKLNFDTRCSKEFLTLLVEVKGSPEQLSTIILTEDQDGQENTVFLTLLKPPAEIKIRRSKLTSAESVFDLELRQLMRLVVTHLVFVRGSGELVWTSRSRVRDLTFSYKHSVSKLLDDSYVKEICEADFSLLYATEITLRGHSFRFEVLGYRSTRKLKIASEERIVELNSKSSEMKLLSELQGLSLTKSITLTRSLELELVVSRLFPKLSAIN